MAKHNKTGKWGEDMACDILIADGWAIVERNWHEGHHELDIIAMKDDQLVFGEVKCRTEMEEDPLEAVDSRKIANIVRAAQAYMVTRPMPHYVRFDLFAVNGTPDNYRIEHIPDAFDPPLRSYH